MSNRWVRFLLAVAAIAAASGAAYRVVEDERRLAADVTATRKAESSGEAALATVEELKAALHAYVAPGQGLPFWSARAGLLLDKLRGSLLELDAALTAAGGTPGTPGSMAEALDAVDQLAASEQRARDHVRSAQVLLAGDVIFVEVRDSLIRLQVQIVQARDRIASAASARQTEWRREQMLLIGGAVGVLAFVMLSLVPVGRSAPVASASARAESHASYGETSSASARSNRVERRRDFAEAGNPSREGGPDAPGPGAAAALAELCSDIAAVAEGSELEPLLNRARNLLSARGVIVWLRSSDGLELHSVAASGYDARVVARLGPIHRETGNLTADAFRENTPKTSAAATSTPAALAVPLPSPDGAAGVFAAELTAGADIDDATLSAARVIAAQLGLLLGSVPAEQAQPPIVRSADL